MTIALSLILAACSKTYEEYTVDVQTSYSVVTNTDTWSLQRFEIKEVANTAGGDTAAFSCVEIQALDWAFPYPNNLYVRFYFNPAKDRMELPVSITPDGFLASVQMIEINTNRNPMVANYVINDTADFQPSVSVFAYDARRKLLTAAIVGAIYEAQNGQKRTLKIEVKNYRIKS